MIARRARIHERMLQRWIGLTLLAGVAGGCLSLSPPDEVTACAAAGTCVNGAKTDAKKDTPPSPEDAARPDAASDAATDGTDARSDAPSPDAVLADAGTDVRDTASDDAKVGADRGPEVMSGPEPSGAEPSLGREPGPEPGPEPGKEPGLEPGREVGPEPGPEPPRDGGGPDSTAPACANATPVTGGDVVVNTTSAFCFVTCDSIEWGWGCDSFTSTPDAGADYRSVAVNGVSVSCGGTLPPKTAGGYYYFQIGPGGHVWDHIHYSGAAATSCPKPAGGYAP